MTGTRASVKKGGTAEVTSCPFKGRRFFYWQKGGGDVQVIRHMAPPGPRILKIITGANKLM
jgi:hypothetical protein